MFGCFFRKEKQSVPCKRLCIPIFFPYHLVINNLLKKDWIISFGILAAMVNSELFSHPNFHSLQVSVSCLACIHLSELFSGSVEKHWPHWNGKMHHCLESSSQCAFNHILCIKCLLEKFWATGLEGKGYQQ